MDHMIVRFSGSLNAPRFPTKMDARVENVPRTDCFAAVFDFSFWHIFFTFRCSCWWVEHSQYLFDECSDLCIGRQRERPQQSYGLRMDMFSRIKALTCVNHRKWISDYTFHQKREKSNYSSLLNTARVTLLLFQQSIMDVRNTIDYH